MMKLRQVALAATSLEPVRSSLMTLLGLDADFADPGVAEFGLENTVMAVGDTFLEVVAPTRADTAASRTLALRGEALCGYMVLFQVGHFATLDARLEALRLRKVWQTDRPAVTAAHVHPKDIGGAIVSFDEMRPATEWVWAGPTWQQRKARNVASIVGCVVGAVNPAALCNRWAEVLDTIPVELTLNLDAGTFISFEQAPRDGVLSVVMATEHVEEMIRQANSLGLDRVVRFVAV